MDSSYILPTLSWEYCILQASRQHSRNNKSLTSCHLSIHLINMHPMIVHGYLKYITRNKHNINNNNNIDIYIYNYHFNLTPLTNPDFIPFSPAYYVYGLYGILLLLLHELILTLQLLYCLLIFQLVLNSWICYLGSSPPSHQWNILNINDNTMYLQHYIINLPGIVIRYFLQFLQFAQLLKFILLILYLLIPLLFLILLHSFLILLVQLIITPTQHILIILIHHLFH